MPSFVIPAKAGIQRKKRRLSPRGWLCFCSLDTGLRRYDAREERLERTERHAARASGDLQLAAQLLELWRLCGKSRCRRARACRGGARRCSEALADWSEALSMKNKRVSFAEAMERLREQSR